MNRRGRRRGRMDETKKTKKPVPVSLAITRTRKRLAEAVNESGLPPCVLEMIVGAVYQELARMAQAQAEADEAEYSKEGE
jgi:hypothetical protein